MGYLTEKLNVQEIGNIMVENIDYNDFPDFCDAFIESAELKENDVWRDATEEELCIINNDRDFVYQEVLNYLY